MGGVQPAIRRWENGRQTGQGNTPGEAVAHFMLKRLRPKVTVDGRIRQFYPDYNVVTETAANIHHYGVFFLRRNKFHRAGQGVEKAS